MRTQPRILSTTILLTLLPLTLPGQAVTVDPAIPAYQKTSGISGNLSSVGSDTLNNLITLWAEGFRREYPGVRIQVEGKGSSTAPPALISGAAQLGPMSRAMKPQEIDDFEKAFGYKPTMIPVAIDGLAVYVHKDNPIEELTLEQLDAIFSKTRKSGVDRSIDTWGELGLTGSWSERPISLYGRNAASGTYTDFKEKALFKGDYKDTVKEQPGSASVVQGVANDLSGIGYSGIGYKSSDVKAVKLAKKPGGPFFSTESEDVLSGKYPLSRFLSIYVNKAPNRPLDPLISEFIRYVLSRQGQEIVIKDGYLPMTEKMVGKAVAAVQ